MIELVNRQRKVSIDPQRWKQFAEIAVKISPAGEASVTIAFVSDRKMRELNRRWRGKDKTTDVLSFPSEQTDFEKNEGLELGDVAISIEQAARQARQNKVTLDNEVSQLILHGVLHLCGYDHETDNGEMNKLELKLRKKLKI